VNEPIRVGPPYPGDEAAAPPKQEDVFAIVELMGHARYGGRLTEEEKFGDKVGRIDAFDGDGVLTIYFSAKSVYRITIVSEAVARQVSKQTQPAPVQPWDFPKQLTAPREPTGFEIEDECDRDD
jgi:hypothetical protein